MALDDFIEQWDRVEKFGEIAKAMHENRGDEEAFNEFYKDLVKEAKEIHGFGDLAPAEDAGMDAKMAYAQEFEQAARDAAYIYSNTNIETIVKDSKPKLGDKFPKLVAALDAKTEKKEHEKLIDVIKKYREAIEPLQTSRERPKPRLDVVMERLYKLVDERLGSDEGIKPYVAALKRFYDRKDEFALDGYARHIIKPAEEKLTESVNRENVPAYMKDNLGEFKKAERVAWYSAVNSELAEAA